jgi:predicted Zn-dependent protease
MKLLATMAIVWLMTGVWLHAQEADTAAFREGQQLYASGKLSEAKKIFEEIVRHDPSNVAAQMYLGQTLFREEKFADAIAPYEKVRALEKAGTKITLIQHRILADQLAMAYGISGRRADSKALLEESIRSDPEYPLNYYNLACLAADEDDKGKVLSNISLAFEHKEHVLKGEQMPDPRADSSFQKYVRDEDFIKLMAKLGYK